MGKKFEECAAKKGSKIRTKSLKKDKYMHVCIPPGDGPSVGGEVKKKKKTSKKGKKHRVSY